MFYLFLNNSYGQCSIYNIPSNNRYNNITIYFNNQLTSLLMSTNLNKTMVSINYYLNRL